MEDRIQKLQRDNDDSERQMEQIQACVLMKLIMSMLNQSTCIFKGSQTKRRMGPWEE